jgi:hypothetical protein
MASASDDATSLPLDAARHDHVAPARGLRLQERADLVGRAADRRQSITPKGYVLAPKGSFKTRSQRDNCHDVAHRNDQHSRTLTIITGGRQ